MEKKFANGKECINEIEGEMGIREGTVVEISWCRC